MPFTITRDAVPPGLTLDAALAGDDILVTWSAKETGSGVYSCTLAMRRVDTRQP